MSVKGLLREPLVHFLLVGGLLFALDRDPGPAVAGDRLVQVSAGRLEQMATVFSRTWMRPPTPEELRGLVRDYALEEIAYRQALAMGLERDDPIVRRRLRQKLDFLVEDEQDLLEPSDDELAGFLAEHAEAFWEDPRYTLEQVYVSLDRHPDDAEAVARTALAELRAGSPAQGDPTLLPETFERATAGEVDTQFGLGFAAQLEDLPLGRWQGPLRSRVGLHLVRLDAREPGRTPELDEVRDVVVREWTAARHAEARREREERLLASYDVVVEWPLGLEGTE